MNLRQGQEEKVLTIDLFELWQIFVKRWWLLLLVAILGSGAAFAYEKLTYVPIYQSSATLYVLRDETSNAQTTSEVSSEFTLALNLVTDCDYILKSHSVLDQVIEDMDFDVTYKELSNSISTYNPDNSRVLEVTVTADSPEHAKELVDSLCEVGADKIADAMGNRQINVFEKGKLNQEPANGISMKKILAVGMGAAILIYMVFLLIFLLDDGIHSNEDVESYLGLSVIGVIPGNGKRPRRDSDYAKMDSSDQNIGKED